MKDLYSILHISKEASKDDIKKAYRKLAFEYHPDKNNNSTSDKFNDISEAYEILSDSKKKKQYDIHGYQNYSDLSAPIDLFSALFGSNFKDLMDQSDKNIFMVSNIKMNPLESLNTPKQVSKGPTMNYILHVSLQELFYGVTKSFSIKHKLKTGSIKKTQYDINIKPGSKSNESIFVKNGGNYLEKQNVTEDLEIRLECKKHNYFTRYNDDLYITKNISIAQSLCDCIIAIDYFDTQLFINTHSVIKNESIMIINDKGMPIKESENDYGDLYIRFLVDLPESLSDYEQQQIKEIWDIPEENDEEDIIEQMNYYGTTDEFLQKKQEEHKDMNKDDIFSNLTSGLGDLGGECVMQ